MLCLEHALGLAACGLDSFHRIALLQVLPTPVMPPRKKKTTAPTLLSFFAPAEPKPNSPYKSARATPALAHDKGKRKAPQQSDTDDSDIEIVEAKGVTPAPRSRQSTILEDLPNGSSSTALDPAGAEHGLSKVPTHVRASLALKLELEEEFVDPELTMLQERGPELTDTVVGLDEAESEEEDVTEWGNLDDDGAEQDGGGMNQAKEDDDDDDDQDWGEEHMTEVVDDAQFMAKAERGGDDEIIPEGASETCPICSTRLEHLNAQVSREASCPHGQISN